MRVAGFFSKETDTPGTNLNCLLVLPQHQRRGFGKLLIQLSEFCLLCFRRISKVCRGLKRFGTAQRENTWLRTQPLT